jgi:hypothetical protein
MPTDQPQSTDRNEFGRRVCRCGTANHDLRRRCRSCGEEIGTSEPDIVKSIREIARG